MSKKLAPGKKTVALICGLCGLLVSRLAAQEVDSVRMFRLEARTVALDQQNEKQPPLKVSGYVQGQYQYGEQDAVLKVGSANENPDQAFSRIGIRRGRMKFTYGTGIASAVFQLDITEKGVGVKDASLSVEDPWCKSASRVKAGVFDRPFGYEISYSSSNRESPERAAIFQTLFPEERDLGILLLLQAAKNSVWSFLKLEAGLFAGNGVKQETDSRRDFIGHLSALKNWPSVSLGGGVSYYHGSVYQGTANVYSMQGKVFTLDNSETNRGRFARREYFGIDAQVAISSVIGTTKVHGEYLFGHQPGTSNGSKSPNASSLPANDIWLRHFSGGYVMLVQGLGKLPVAIIAKYDWYDPNTQTAGSDAGIAGSGTSAADLAQHTVGFGALWNLHPALRLTAYYDINRHETSASLPAMVTNLKNDMFTVRVQYKF